MAKPNYSFEKRQKELAKKKKHDEKEQRKAAAKAAGNPEPVEDADTDAAPHDLTPALLSPRWNSARRSEEHTSELQSLMRISYDVFSLKKNSSQQYNTQQHESEKNR